MYILRHLRVVKFFLDPSDMERVDSKFDVWLLLTSFLWLYILGLDLFVDL